MQSIYFFTSFSETDLLSTALVDFNPKIDHNGWSFPSIAVSITDGDDYFLAQREGMLNFFSTLADPDHMEVHSKFLMHLASCVKGYRIEYKDGQVLLPLLNALIKELRGVVFAPSMDFYTTDWKRIIGVNGSCEVDEYDVFMSAATYDAQLDISENEETISRKNKSKQILQQKGIPVLESLPVILSSEQMQYRSDTELAKRIIALAAVAVKGELKKSDVSFSVLQKFGIVPDDVSPVEGHFLQNEFPEEQEFVNMIWRYESLYVMMWAAGLIDDIHFADQIAPVSDLVGIIRDFRDMDELLMNINEKDASELLEELDLSYRLHWACTDARINGRSVPADVNASVVYERHYALNWLVNRYNESWDDVSTPT